VAVTNPKQANLAVEPNLPYFALVGYEVAETEDFDTFFGDWEVDPFNTDDATTGVWEVDDPIETVDGSYINQPGSDNTPGPSSLCAFTQNGPSADGLGAYDVDGGATSLRSPFFDATIYDDPAFTYYRWYANDAPTSANPGNDVWQVFITNDGSDWVRVERTHTSDNSWRRNAIRISDYVSPTDQVALLFVAQDSVIPGSDLDGGSLVEAAVDDLQLWGVGETIIDTTEDTTGGNAVLEWEVLSALYPNPADQQFVIETSADLNEAVFTVFNQLGEAVLNEIITVRAGQKHIVQVGNILDGIYTVVLQDDGKSTRKTLVIQH
jgi:hypothetical protein